ncbi:MAG: hypothetical protein RBS43_07685 [Candidatus Cloacimonas sp.]|jgi:hypothetical protein|nr:hypothetical protein [Candidatus Cloacimonas sp.]
MNEKSKKKPDSLIDTPKVESESAEGTNLGTSSDIIFQEALPSLYQTNAFRVCGMFIDGSTRDLTRQIQNLKLALKYNNKLPPNALSCFHSSPWDSESLDSAIRRLHDPERRLIDELFWFWPIIDGDSKNDIALNMLAKNDVANAKSIWMKYGTNSSERTVSIHNLAVLSHLSALDYYYNSAAKSLAEAESEERNLFWKESFKYWKILFDLEDFWNKLTNLVIQMDDPRLTEDTVKRIRKNLPVALLLINAKLAITSAESGSVKDTRGQIGLIDNSGFDQNHIMQAKKIAINPISQRIKTMCTSAYSQAMMDTVKAIECSISLIKQTESLLATLDLFLPADDSNREAIHNEIVDTIIKIHIEYINKTEDYQASLQVLLKLKPIAIGKAAKSRIEEKIKIVEDIIDFGNYWCLPGYFLIPATEQDVLEKARELEEKDRFDEAYRILKNILFSVSDHVARKQFIHCIAYCLRRKAIRTFNDGLDDNNKKFDKLISGLVRYRMSELDSLFSKYGSTYSGMSSSTNCAHCNRSIYGTYYTRTISGIKQPFCDTCNNKIDRDIQDLERELNKIRGEALNLIVLANYLAPYHKPTKMDLATIRESADKNKLHSKNPIDLMIEYELLGIEETIDAIHKNNASDLPKLFKHLVKIVGAKPPVLLTKKLLPLFENKSNQATLLSYYLANITIFWEFIKFAFVTSPEKITEEIRVKAIESVLVGSDYDRVFELFNLIGYSNINQKEHINRLSSGINEMVIRVVKSSNPTDIQFTSGSLRNIISLADGIDSELKNNLIHTIILTAARIREKAIRIIYSLSKDTSVSEIFYALMFNNDSILPHEERYLYLAYLLQHWDKSIRKSSLEWAIRNSKDESELLKLLIISLADPESEIRNLASQTIIASFSEESFMLLLEACYTDDKQQLTEIQKILSQIFLTQVSSSRDISKPELLVRVCLIHKDEQFIGSAQQILNANVPDWMSGSAVKSEISYIKHIAKYGESHNVNIAKDILVKFAQASIGNRIKVFFTKMEDSRINNTPDWWRYVQLNTYTVSSASSTKTTDNPLDEYFERLQTMQYTLKPILIEGLSKVCYDYALTPDGKKMLISLFCDRGYLYDGDKEISNFWDLYSLDLKNGELKRLFYLKDQAYIDIVQLNNQSYATDSTGRVVGWDWKEDNGFKYLNKKLDIYDTYPLVVKDDVLIQTAKSEGDIYYSSKNKLKQVFTTDEGEWIYDRAKISNSFIISKQPIGSKGYTDYNAPYKYHILSFNDDYLKPNKSEILSESFQGEYDYIKFYDANSIIYAKKISKDESKYDIYIKEFSSRKRDTLILSNINLALLESKPGYIMYLQKDENSDMSSLYMHRIATNEKIRLIHLETNGVRISSDWSRLAYRVILGNGNYQEDLSNFYIVNLDPDKNDDLQAHISSESNTYKTIKDTF